MLNKNPQVAVLGAGVMGSATALYLARDGARVSLFDAAASPFSAASRWNEGKIHLGYIYAHDSTMETAKKVLPGGLAFRCMIEELLGISIENVITPTNDIYLCHRGSVVKPDAMQAYYRAVSKMVREHSDAGNYLSDVSDCKTRKLTKTELEGISDSDQIVAGFHVPERSVSTVWVADRFIDAINSQNGIDQYMNTRITEVYPENKENCDGRWYVKSGENIYGPFDYVINSLWEGRMSIDQTAGLKLPSNWTNRYRLSLFIRTTDTIDLPCVIIATGPFGDIKNYNQRDFYLSWYPKGLIHESSSITPPQIQSLDKSEQREVSDAIMTELCKILPHTQAIKRSIESMNLQGGWVFAQGKGGELSDPSSTLHRRSNFGVIQHGAYISIDTGKYSTAPWLARQVADRVLKIS